MIETLQSISNPCVEASRLRNIWDWLNPERVLKGALKSIAFGAFFLGILTCQNANAEVVDSPKELAKHLPADIGFFAVAENPSKLLLDAMSSIDCPPESAEEIVSSIVGLEGLRSKTAAEDLISDCLFNTEGACLIVANSSDSVGDFGLALKMRKDSSLLKADALELRETFQMLFKISRKTVSVFFNERTRAGGQFESQLNLFGSGLTVEKSGDWLVVTHSTDLRAAILSGLQGAKTSKRSLGDSRAFVEASKSVMSDSSISYFLNPRKMNALINVWPSNASDALINMGWVQYSAKLFESDSGFECAEQTVFRRLVPNSGRNDFWSYYRPIEAPPYHVGEWKRLFARNVDLSSWNMKYWSDLKESGQNPESIKSSLDPVNAFLSGLSRKAIGGNSLIAELENGTELSLYKIADDGEQLASEELAGFFKAIKEGYAKAGYKANLNGEGERWDLEVTDQFLGMSGRNFGREAQATVDQKKVESNGWARKLGTIQNGWCVIGTGGSVDAAVSKPKGVSFVERLKDLQSSFDSSEKPPHSVMFISSSELNRSMRRSGMMMLNNLFGESWFLGNKSYQKIVESGFDSELMETINDCQKFGCLVRRVLDRVEDKKAVSERFDFVDGDNYFVCRRLSLGLTDATQVNTKSSPGD